MKMTPVTSSNIAAIGYDKDAKELFVEFKSGKTFKYAGVFEDEYTCLIEAVSVGSHFFRKIKGVKVGSEVVIAVTDDINTDDELVAEVDAAYEKVSNGTAVFTSNAEVNKMMEEKKSIFKSVADENFKNMKLAIQQCGAKDKVIAEQTMQIEFLREALINVDNLLSGYIKPPAAVKLAIHKARKALGRIC